MNIPVKYVALADQLILSGTSFMVVLMAARELSLEHLGIFSMLFLFIMTSGSLLQAFIIRPLMVLGGKKEEVESFSKKMYWLSIVSTAAIALVSAGFFPLYLMTSQLAFEPTWVLILLFLSFLYLKNDFVRKAFYLRKAHFKALFSGGINSGIQLGGIAFLALTTQFNLSNLLIVLLFGHSLQFLISSIWLGVFRASFISFQELKETGIECWNYSKWLLNKALVQWFSGNFVLLAAGSILGPAALGAIKIAQHLTGLINVALLALENFLPQNASALYSKSGFDALKSYTGKTTQKIVLASLPILLVVSIFTVSILNLLYGSSGETEVLSVRVFCLIQFFIILLAPLRIAFLAMSETKVLFMSYSVCAGICFLLSQSIISSFGLLGCFALLLFVQLFNLAVLLFYFNENKSKKTETCESYI